MSNPDVSQRNPRQGFTFPSLGRVLIYLCALVIVCWSVGPFLWQMLTSLQTESY
jgi:ABC-type glycerol-3-phosphate transport system permease component